MKVVSLKMVSGEEIVAEVVHDDADYVTMNRPRVLQVVPTHEGMQMALYPWLMSNTDMGEVRIPKDRVIVMSSTQSDVAKNYIQQVSGIQLASTLLG